MKVQFVKFLKTDRLNHYFQMKILIIRFSSIGDIVLTTPVIRCIKQQLKEVELHYLIKPQFEQILSHNPYIDKILLLQKNLSDTIDEIRKEKYTHIIDLHHNLRTFYIKTRVAASFYSFRKLNFQKWLLVNLGINLMPDLHIVDRYFEAVKKLNVKNDQKGLDYFILEEENIKNILPDGYQNDYIVFAIGAKHDGKKLPLKLITEICKQMNQPVILVGDQNDFDNGELIRQSSGNNIFNACGKYTLNQSALIIKNASVVITHDTGLMHIAAAFKKKIISIWIGTTPVLGMYPYLPHLDFVMILPKGYEIRPSSKLGDKTGSSYVKRVKAINIEEIISAAKK